MDDFAARLSVGPIDIDLSDRDLAHLEAVISQARPARELANPNVAQTLAKLKAIRTYNVKRRALGRNSGLATQSNHQATGLAEWCREKIRELAPFIGHKDDEIYENEGGQPRHLRIVTTEFVQRLALLEGFEDLACDIDISRYSTAQRLIALLVKFERALLKAVQETEPEAHESGPVVVLGRRGQPVTVLGKRKPALTTARHNVIQALIEAGEAGLTKDELVHQSKHADARQILKRLATSDSDWAKAILLPGTTGGRYRLRRE